MRLFHGKDINAQVTSFNDTILSIFKNDVPNKYITIDEKDLVQKNDTIKAKIKTKNLLFKQYIQHERFESDFGFLKALINELNELISSTLYYENLAKKLNNPLLQAKTYWSILKTFYNDKKILLISPLLIDDKFVTDY